MKSIDVDRAALFGLWALLILLFGLWPTLDLWFSGLFFHPVQGFTTGPVLQAVNDAVPWIGRAMLLLALGLVLLSWLTRALVSRRQARRAGLLLLSLVLGLGLLVHTALKNQWGRARPHAVTYFGGPATFSSPLTPARQCRRNCSFVTGHAATGFALIALGMLGPTRRRRQWLLLGVSSGLLIGLLRVAMGDHFLSDVLFSLAFMWSACLLIRWAWLVRVWQRRNAARPRSQPPP